MKPQNLKDKVTFMIEGHLMFIIVVPPWLWSIEVEEKMLSSLRTLVSSLYLGHQ